jgi:geranylgeranylglycerol-phosphate geranylgeranyltransferase
VSYVELARLQTVVALALLAYGIGMTAGVPPLQLLAGTLAIACAVAGGHAYNDLRDQVCDRLNRPTRPLVSGRLTERQAGRFIALMFGAALVFAVATRSMVTIAFIVLVILASVLYSNAIKPVTGLKNVFVGAWCGVLPWGASLDRAETATVVIAASIVALFITQKELIADVNDRDGDAAAGIRTVPVAVGPRVALLLVATLNVALFLVARAAPVAVLPELRFAAQLAAVINVIAVYVVTARAYLRLQKVLLIGGCVGLFAIIALQG